jgi:iron complex transport system ATP-binding protein
VSAPAAVLLEARGLGLSLSGRVLLDGFDWQVRAGEFWCVLGRNGIGKSSLLHAAAGLLRPGRGELLLRGQPLRAIPPTRMALHRGLLLQQQYDAFSMTVVEAVMAGRFAHGAGWGAEADSRAHALHALAQVGLGRAAGADLLTLSGGERQRVALATLLVQDPDLYLLDEPTSHQDIAAQLEIMALLRSLAIGGEGKAVVASCHDVNLARRFATHVLLLGERRRWSGPAASTMQPEVLGEAFGCGFEQVGEGALQIFVSVPR